jgi:RND family efflux transporter MFP subunit
MEAGNRVHGHRVDAAHVRTLFVVAGIAIVELSATPSALETPPALMRFTLPAPVPALPITALIALGVAGCGRSAPPLVELPPPQVRVARPVARDVTEYVVFTGNAAAVEEVDLRARVAGFVTKIHFNDGERVSQGQPLFSIDDRPYKIARDQAAADVDKQTAELVELEREVARNAPLVAKNVITREQYEILVAKRDMSQALLEKARAALAKASLDLEFCTITSPLDGRISARNVSPGDLVTADSTGSRPLTTVVRTKPVHVYFEADERSVLRSRAQAQLDRMEREANGGEPVAWRNIKELAIPVEVALVSDEGFPRRGVLDFVDVAAAASTGTIRCRAELANADELVLPGMFVRVRLPAGDPEPAVLVPERAIGLDQGRRYVCVVGSDGRVEHRTVEPGIQDGDLRVIVKGLSGDEKIVVEGIQKARDGALVRPVEASGPSTSDGA